MGAAVTQLALASEARPARPVRSVVGFNHDHAALGREWDAARAQAPPQFAQVLNWQGVGGKVREIVAKRKYPGPSPASPAPVRGVLHVRAYAFWISVSCSRARIQAATASLR